jgi:predicted adenylyl cyclase CyaB
MKNLEIKVATHNIEDIKSKTIKIGAEDFGILYQVDTYFLIGKNRLKLREEKNRSYLVFYVRPDTLNSKFSKYYIINISLFFSKFIKKSLAFIFGVKVVVNKTRNLFIYKNTRIHLDEVKSLGSYVELETVFKEGGDEEELKKEHNFIIESLSLNKFELVKESYSDLVLFKKL